MIQMMTMKLNMMMNRRMNRMKALKKAGLNKYAPISCDIMYDRYKEDYWRKAKLFLNRMKNANYEELNKNQRDWLHEIKGDLEKEGLI